MSFSKYILVLLATFCLPTVLFAQDSAPTDQRGPAELVAVLSSDASVFDKAKACQRLAVVGDSRAVPSLAALLADEKLSNYARYALETIPDSSALSALQHAAAHLQGDLLAGVLNSIAQRRDAKAVPMLQEHLGSENATVARAAARALGHIGGPQAAGILRDALAKAAPQRRAALAQACLICAQRFVQQNERDQAVGLYDFVRKADLPMHLTLAATHGAILAQGNDAMDLFVEQLNSEEEARFRLALQAARALEEGDVAPQLVAQFSKQPPERQVLLLLALGDLGGEDSVPTVRKAAESPHPQVRIQAIRVLAQLADAGAAGTVLDAAFDADERIARAARSSLASWKGDGIDAAVVGLLESGDANKCQVAIELAAQRNLASAAPALLRLADSPDAAVRLMAVKALGSTIELKDLSKLLVKAQVAYTPAELAAARQAVRAACVRMPQEECAALLADRLPGADTDTKVFLLQQLGAVGGPKALETMVAAARDRDDAMQDAATRVLGEWLSADASPAMFQLAQSMTSGKYKIRVLRGYVRLARQLDMPLEQRMEICRNTLKIAERAEEKLLVLEVLDRHPAPGGLAIAASLLQEPKLKEQACGTIVVIAAKVVGTSPAQVEEALKQVLEATGGGTIAERARQIMAQARKSLESN